MAKSFPNTGATVIDATADLPGSPSEGMMVFQKDTNELKIYDGSSWVSMLDTDNAPMAAWTTWTPVIGQNGTKTITNTNSKYLQLGKLIVARCNVLITQAGTAGNYIYCSYPITPAAYSDTSIGSFFYGPTGNATRYTGSVITNSVGLLFQTHNINNVLGITPSFATVNGDFLSFTVVYEAA